MTEWEAAHAQLGPASLAYARYLLAAGGRVEPLNVDELSPFHRAWPLRQRVPLLIDEDFHAAMAADAAAAGAIIVDLPRRLARHAPEMAALFYGIGDAAQAVALLNHDDYQLESYRLDMACGPTGFQIVEANAGARSSGFYACEWLSAYADLPLTRRFLDQRPAALRCIDTLERFIDVYIGAARDLPHVRRTGKLGFAMTAAPGHAEALRRLLPSRVGPAADRAGLAWTADVVDDEGTLAVADGHLYLGDRAVDVLVRAAGGQLSREMYALHQARALLILDTPTSFFSMEKRNFALLTAHRRDELFSDRELATIDRLIPWTTLMAADRTVFDEQAWSVRDLAFEAQDELVLKDSQTYAGQGVSVGRYMAADVWRALVEAHLGDHRWLLQRRCDSSPYILQDPAAGAVEHDVVWGYFIVAGQPAGGTIRVKPRNSTDGVVNVGRGGTEGLFCLCE